MCRSTRYFECVICVGLDVGRYSTLAEVEEVGKVVGLDKEAVVKGGVELAC